MLFMLLLRSTCPLVMAGPLLPVCSYCARLQRLHACWIFRDSGTHARDATGGGLSADAFARVSCLRISPRTPRIPAF